MTAAMDQYLAIDCEMVGCRFKSQLARVAIVDHTGTVVYHSFVFVHPANVIDYRTNSSGIRAEDLVGAPTFETVCAEVRALIGDKVLVGHALFNDLAAIEHRHQYENMRDTALFYPLRRLAGVTNEGQYPALRKLTKEVLGREIRKGEHNPIEDARSTMEVFLAVRAEYEDGLANGDDVIAWLPTSMGKWYK